MTIPTEANAKITELEVTPSGDVFALLGTDLVKWRADGALDLAFGGNGRVERPSDRSFTHFALDPNGDVVVSGNRFGGANDGWVGRFDGATGTRDAGFGTDGAVYFTQRRTDEVGVDSAGRPIVAVTDSNPTSRKLIRLGHRRIGGLDVRDRRVGQRADLLRRRHRGRRQRSRVVASSNGIDIVRYTPSGELDPSFPRTLVTGTPPGALVDGSGRVIVISTGTYAATRILSTGGLDTSFGEAGRLREPNGLDDPHGALDASGRILFVGKKTNTNDVDVRALHDRRCPRHDVCQRRSGAPAAGARRGPAAPCSDDVLAGVDGSGRLVVSARTARPSTYTTKQVVTIFRLVPEPPADTGAPEITITTPIDGATYLSTDGWSPTSPAPTRAAASSSAADHRATGSRSTCGRGRTRSR